MHWSDAKACVRLMHSKMLGSQMTQARDIALQKFKTDCVALQQSTGPTGPEHAPETQTENTWREKHVHSAHRCRYA